VKSCTKQSTFVTVL